MAKVMEDQKHQDAHLQIERLPLPSERRCVQLRLPREIVDNCHPSPAAPRTLKTVRQHRNGERPTACADERLDVEFQLIGTLGDSLHPWATPARAAGAQPNALCPDVVQRGDFHAERNRNIIRLQSIGADDSVPIPVRRRSRSEQERC